MMKMMIITFLDQNKYEEGRALIKFSPTESQLESRMEKSRVKSHCKLVTMSKLEKFYNLMLFPWYCNESRCQGKVN